MQETEIEDDSFAKVIEKWFSAETEEAIAAARNSVVGVLRRIQKKNQIDSDREQLKRQNQLRLKWREDVRNLELDHLKRLPKDRTEEFGNVESFLIFVSAGSSGHTLVGSILDAHPEMCVAHEVDVMELLLDSKNSFSLSSLVSSQSKRMSREQLFSLLAFNSRNSAKIGRYWNDHFYEIPNQCQGRYEKLRVIGDKRGGPTATALFEHPERLTQLQEWVGVPLKVINVTRNPYDTLVSGVERFGSRFEARIHYLQKAYRATSDALATLPDDAVYHLRHEEFTNHPEKVIGEILQFLGLKAPDGYIGDCAKIVWRKPDARRRELHWDEKHVAMVGEIIGENSFLSGYDFDI